MKIAVSVIIVHWNTPRKLRNSLKILSRSDNLELIIIDNNSSESVSWIKESFPSTILIENKFNRGYAAACNQGLIVAKNEWCLFLNPDVEMNEEKILRMVEATDKQKFDAASIKTTDAYQKPLPTWITLLIEFSPLNRLFSLSWFSPKTLFGGCLLIKKSVLVDLGGWDERFFLWFEDSDLTKRLVNSGYKIGWFNFSLTHTGGSSFNKLKNQERKEIFFNSMEIYARKYFSFFGRQVIKKIKERYSRRYLLPIFSRGLSITVPNMYKENLRDFFANNKNFLSCIPELIVVTSSVDNKEIWDWRKKYPGIRFINIKYNPGFATTVNLGFRVSSGEWIGTVNDDVILNNDWLKNLLSCKSTDIGSLNPVIYNTSGEIESAGIDILPEGKAVPKKTASAKHCIEVDSTNAAAILYQKEALNTVGLFDELFGSYLEDIDLSLRLRRKGFKNIVCTSSKITHLGQTTSKKFRQKKAFLDFKNWILVILKNWGIRKTVKYLPLLFLERLRNISGIMKAYFEYN